MVAIVMRRTAQVFLVAGFLGYTGWTSFRSFAHVAAALDHPDKPEVRRLAAFDPSRQRSWKNLPEQFEAVFEPRVEGRDIYVRRFARLKLKRLDVSPTPRVWLGEDGWLYYNHEADSSYYAAGDPRLDARLGQWTVAMAQWRAWLAYRGIRFLVVIAPDKSSVYPEFLPAVQRKLIRSGPLDDLLDRWRLADEQLDILDLRDPLRAAKADRQVYFRTDTHWLPDGAVAGYRATARALGFEPAGDDAFTGGPGPTKAGDIAAQFGWWPHGEEPFEHRELKSPRARRAPVSDPSDAFALLDYLDVRCWERPGGGAKALLFHDSFGHDFYAGLLAEHFGRLLAVPSNHLDPALIEREKPDVVIFEIVERLLQGVTPRRPADPPRRSMAR